MRHFRQKSFTLAFIGKIPKVRGIKATAGQERTGRYSTVMLYPHTEFQLRVLLPTPPHWVCEVVSLSALEREEDVSCTMLAALQGTDAKGSRD